MGGLEGPKISNGNGGDKHAKPLHFSQYAENNLHQAIDATLRDSILGREGKNSLARCWEQVLDVEKIPIDVDQQIKYFAEQMDRTELKGYKTEQRTQDKEFTERILQEFNTMKTENPKGYKERLIGRVFGHAIASAWDKNQVLEDGDEEISLEKHFLSHPFDWKKRQVEQVLSFKDVNNLNRENYLAIAVQWGHFRTDTSVISNRIKFIAQGIEDYGSMTELRYTPVKEGQEMPIFVPMAVVGGDIKLATTMIDAVIQGRVGDVKKNPILFKSLIQVQTQMNLFCQVAEKCQISHLKKISRNEIERQKNLFVGSELDKAVLAYRSMKDIFDKIVSMNDPLIQERTKVEDPIDLAIINGCHEIAGEYGLSLKKKDK